VPHSRDFVLWRFLTRPQERVDSVVIPASKNLHNRRLTQRSNYQLFARVRSVVNAAEENLESSIRRLKLARENARLEKHSGNSLLRIPPRA